MLGPPRFVAGHPDHSEAEIVVHADDVAVDVVAEVVRIPPLRRDTDHVPLPRVGVDLGIVHPVPLAVADVVADLHVLDALRQGECGGPDEPAEP
jgi:hypothetical protein